MRMRARCMLRRPRDLPDMRWSSTRGSRLRDWYYVPGNTTTVDKLLNSGAAFREVLAGDGRILGPHIDRIRFQRYRLTAAAGGPAV